MASQNQLWELQRNNGRGLGSASLPLPQHSNTENTEEIEVRNGGQALAARSGQRPADQSHLRRGLSHEIKADMIEMFARFQSVSQVADMLKKDHGVVLDRRTIESFNPDSHRCRVGKRLKSLFKLHRDAYIKEAAKVAVSHQAHRLRLIGEIVDKATTAKDFGNALKGLELAAKEMGGLAQEVKHTGVVSHVHGTVEEARRELADRLRTLVPAIDLAPCKLTEEECKLTVEPDNADSADMQAMPTPALVAPALPMDNSERQDNDARGDNGEASQASGQA